MAIKNYIYGVIPKDFPQRPRYGNVGPNPVAFFTRKSDGAEIQLELVPVGHNFFRYPSTKADIEILQQFPTHRILLGKYKTRKEALASLTEILSR